MAGTRVFHWGAMEGAAFGALGGAALGAVGANNIGNQDGVEVVVRLDSGRTLAVVQGADMVFTPGQQVMVLRGNGTTRVAPR